jgi:hypothetical protein
MPRMHTQYLDVKVVEVTVNMVASGETTLIPLPGYIISLTEISIHQSPSYGYGFEMQ